MEPQLVESRRVVALELWVESPPLSAADTRQLPKPASPVLASHAQEYHARVWAALPSAARGRMALLLSLLLLAA
jgi:hypothetical protein